MYFPNNEDRYLELAEKWMNGTITSAEKQEFSTWYNARQDNIVLLPPDFTASEEALKERILQNIRARCQKDAPAIPLRRYSFIRAAAAVLLILLAGSSWYYFHAAHSPAVAATTAKDKTPKNDLMPGSDKAILTLADGTSVALDTTRNGSSIRQGNTKITVLNAGQLAYDATGSGTPGKVLYNSISTPKGSQYQLVLPDGTKVWLNAASSLRFPTSFTGSQRTVELSGEAYFEVAKNAAKPFYVRVNDFNVQVLGTHFNLMAYKDENTIKTTLMEGAVKITHGAASGFLTPGREAVADMHAGGIKMADADVERVMAWKNGLFQFNNEDINTIMREIARWYDATIYIAGHLENKNFTGQVRRDVPVSKVLKMLELTGGVHFRIEGNKINVLP